MFYKRNNVDHYLSLPENVSLKLVTPDIYVANDTLLSNGSCKMYLKLCS